MELFIPFLILCYGVSHIITESELLSGVRYFIAARSRWLGQLLRCQICCGFWVGVVGAWVYPDLLRQLFSVYTHESLLYLAGGAMSSGFIALATKFERG